MEHIKGNIMAIVANIAASDTSKMDAFLTEEYLAQRFGTSRLMKPLMVETTKDAGYLHQYYLLRDEMDKAHHPIDGWDMKSEIMVARRGNHCVGGARISISDGRAASLPMIAANPALAANLAAGYSYGELSMLAVLDDSHQDEVKLALLQQFISYCARHGVDYAVSLCSVPMARELRRFSTAHGLKCMPMTAVESEDMVERSVLVVMDVRSLSIQDRLAAAQTGMLDLALAD